MLLKQHKNYIKVIFSNENIKGILLLFLQAKACRNRFFGIYILFLLLFCILFLTNVIIIVDIILSELTINTYISTKRGNYRYLEYDNWSVQHG